MSELTRDEIERVMLEFLKCGGSGAGRIDKFFKPIGNGMAHFSLAEVLDSPAIFCAILDELERRYREPYFCVSVNRGYNTRAYCVSVYETTSPMWAKPECEKPIIKEFGRTRYEAAFRAALAVLGRGEERQAKQPSPAKSGSALSPLDARLDDMERRLKAVENHVFLSEQIYGEHRRAVDVGASKNAGAR